MVNQQEVLVDNDSLEHNVVYIDNQQGDMVHITAAINEAAENDELQCIFITCVDSNGVIKMGRAGGFTNIQDFLLLLGALDVQMDYIRTKLVQLEEEDFIDEEDLDEEE